MQTDELEILLLWPTDYQPDWIELLKSQISLRRFSSVEALCEATPAPLKKIVWIHQKMVGPADLSSFIKNRQFKNFIYSIQTGHMEVCIKAMREGALDVLEENISFERVQKMLKNIEPVSLGLNQQLNDIGLHPDEFYHGLVGRSPVMKKIFSLIERVHESSVNILITGPSGVGKEMVAKALHETSARAQQKIVAINCSAIPDALLEGELFGYKRGAFTDARTNKIGLFQEAEKGTLFLDEIGDMPLTIQPKILRALQEKEIRPLGSIQAINVDVRIIAATNQNLIERMNQKQFREDLYYRLNAMQIEIPSLRERPEDIPLLVHFFLNHFQKVEGHSRKTLSPRALNHMIEYTWPGNVREMINVIERASLLSKGDEIQAEDLLFTKDESPLPPVNEWAQKHRALDDVEKEYILEVLQSVGGNRSHTAEILGIGRKTLYNKLAKYGVHVSGDMDS